MNEKLQRFLSWASTNGLRLSGNISIRDFAEFGYGGHVDTEVTDEKLPFQLIKIPLKASISAITALESDFGKQFLRFAKIPKEKKAQMQHTNNDLFEKNNILFYLFLIRERFIAKTDSFWFPYLELLPDSFDTSIFFSQEELDALEGTNLLSKKTKLTYLHVIESTLSVREKLGFIFQRVVVPLTKECPNWFPASEFTFERLIWAFSCVWSRVFPVKALYNNEWQVYPTLLPLIDILNHQYNSKVTYNIDYDGSFFNLESRAPLAQGIQVFNNYGGKSNDSFLLSYGFVIPDNTEDTHYIQLGFNDADQNLVHRKQEIITKSGYDLGHYLRKDKLPKGLIGALRICAMTSNEVYFNANQKPDHFEQMITFRNEHAVFQSLKRLLRQKLSAMIGNVPRATAMEQLREQIAKAVTNRHEMHMHNIYVYKLGQVEILSNNLSMVQTLERDCITSDQLTEQLPSYIKYYHVIGFMDKSECLNWLQSKNTSGKNIHIASDLKLSIDATTNDFLVLSNQDVINYATVSSDPLGKAIRKLNNEELFDEETTIMLYLLYHKFCPVVSGNSQWKFFFDSLTDFNTTLFYPDHVLEWLANTSLLEETKELKEELEATFQDIFNTCSQNRHFAEQFNVANNVLCFEHFLWAYTVYDTLYKEGNIIPVPGLYSPVFYHPNKYIDQRIKPDDSIHFQLVFKTNEQRVDVQNNYLATLGNDELMLRYGAFFEDVGDLYFPLTLDSVSLEPLLDHAYKGVLLEHLNLDFEHVLRKRRGKKVTPPKRLLDMLRICFMTKDEATRYHDLIVKYNAANVELVIQNEKHVTNTVLSVLMSILNSFSSSIEDDEQMLKKLASQECPSCEEDRERAQKQMCVRYRMHLKQVVQDTLEAVEDLMNE